MKVPGYTQENVCGKPRKHQRYNYVDYDLGIAECNDCGIEYKVPRDIRKRDAQLDAIAETYKLKKR